MDSWKQIGPKVVPKGQTLDPDVKVNVTGRITAIVIHPQDPDTIYVGTAQGGIWKTINGGKHWSPTSDNAISLAIGDLAMDPNNPDVLYAGTGEGNYSAGSQYGLGILKTTNGGKTWESKGWEPKDEKGVSKNTFANARFCRIVVNPKNSNYIFAATRSEGKNLPGIYRSTDAGESWLILTSGLPSNSDATDIVLDTKNPDIAYAAFYEQGIFKTKNANASTPKWDHLNSGLPSSGFTRIALGISPSSPQTLYALMSGPDDDNPDNAYLIDKFYSTTNGGDTWDRITLPGADLFGTVYPNSLGNQGNYNISVSVNPVNPDIVYLSGISVWKAERNSSSGQWTITNVGSAIHSDNHALTFDPKDHLKIYAGNDGGIYRSDDGGDTWIDIINKGLSITQFEFMEQDPKDDKRIIAGTQDNGTVIYTGKPEFYQSAEGDGGFVCIDPNQPQNVWHTYNNLAPEFSSQGGDFGTWHDLSEQIKKDESNFYPPMTLDKTNSNNIAIGGKILYIDYSKGKGDHTTGQKAWADRIDLKLPVNNDKQDLISAINFVNTNFLYVGTNHGRVYCVTGTKDNWKYNAIQSSPLPERYIWDIATLPGDEKKIIVVVSGFGEPPRDGHVFRGEVSQDNKSATWTDISGTGYQRLPNIPVNALAIDENKETTMYIGTDIGVFCTIDGGTTWMSFSKDLPVCQVYDLRLNNSGSLLRAATHGRGMWQWSDNTDPIVIPFSDGRLALFRIYPTKQHVYYKYQNTDLSWNPNPPDPHTWTNIPQPGIWYDYSYGPWNFNLPFGTRPVIVRRRADNTLMLFWTGFNFIYHAFEVGPNMFTYGMNAPWQNVTWTYSLGDLVVSPEVDGKVVIFFMASSMWPEARSISNKLHYMHYSLSSSPFIDYIPFSFKGDWPTNRRPTIAQNKDGRLNVFMMDIDGKLYHCWQTTKIDSDQLSWSEWAELGESLANEPVVANNDDGRLELFMINAEDGQLYHRWQTTPNDSTQWSSRWNPLNTPSLPREAPTVVRDGDGRLELFMVGVDGKLYHCWQTAKNDSTGWSKNWELYTAPMTTWRLTSNPVASRNADGRLELFMVGVDDQVYRCRQKEVTNSGEWSDWELL